MPGGFFGRDLFLFAFRKRIFHSRSFTLIPDIGPCKNRRIHPRPVRIRDEPGAFSRSRTTTIDGTVAAAVGELLDVDVVWPGGI